MDSTRMCDKNAPVMNYLIGYISFLCVEKLMFHFLIADAAVFFLSLLGRLI